MGRVFEVYLEGSFYCCKYCNTHLAHADDVISKSFQCKHGKAYLFNKVVNVTFGEEVGRQMMTGLHYVKDLFCVKCGSIVGWKYEGTSVQTETYKEGKSVLERFKVLGPGGSMYWFQHGVHYGGSY